MRIVVLDDCHQRLEAAVVVVAALAVGPQACEWCGAIAAGRRALCSAPVPRHDIFAIDFNGVKFFESNATTCGARLIHRNG